MSLTRLTLAYRRFLTLTASATVAALLSGCGGMQGAAFPDAGSNPAVISPGAITGNVYGGHAPLVGAHIYLVQPGTTGYGSQVTSLLTQSQSATYPLYTNGSFPNTTGSDQFVPSGFQGVLTSSAGEFNISGDYSCQAGLPVILIGYGGSPSYAGTSPNVFQISNATTYNNGSTGVYLNYTVSSPPELFYVGEPVSITGATGGAVGFNQSGTVLASASVQTTTTGTATAQPLSTTQFSIFVPYNATLTSSTQSGLNSGSQGQVVTATPAFNPAAVNMAVLGNCPSAQPLTALTIAGSGSPYTVSVTAANTLAAGNTVTFAGLTGAAAALNGTAGQVQSSGLSSTGFTARVTTGTAQTAGSYTSSTGTFFAGFSNLNYVYVNEISTTATAYAFAGFTNTLATLQNGNVAPTAQTGYDEFHIGSSGTTQGLQGLANAALTAANLYDIQGSNTAAGNPDGDVHIARTTTASGTGTVSTNSINLVGNILAACVDSNNTTQATASSNTQSPQCATLGQYAEDNGIVDLSSAPVLTHRAANIAQAAFNIARFPQGNGTSNNGTVTPPSTTSAAAFITGLVGTIGGNAPFTPYLGSTSNTTGVNSGSGSGNGSTNASTSNPNDLSVVIDWSNAAANGGTAVGLNDVAIDAFGNAWAPGNGTTAQVFQFSPAGKVTGYTGAISTSSEQIAIDTQNRAWVPGVAGTLLFTPGTTAATIVGAANSTNGGGIALDTSTNQYIASNGRSTTASLVKQNVNGTAAGGNFPLLATSGNCIFYLGYLALDANNNLWTGSASPYSPNTDSICRYDSSGNLQFSYLVSIPANGNFTITHQMVVDYGNNLWTADKNKGNIYKFAANTTTNNTGATIVNITNVAPIGFAVDGANTIWVSNQTTTPGGGGLVQISNNVTQMSPGFYTSGPVGSETKRSGLGQEAIDSSGNLWVTGGTFLYEYVGIAAPAVTPLVTAKAAGAIGTRP